MGHFHSWKFSQDSGISKPHQAHGNKLAWESWGERAGSCPLSAHTQQGLTSMTTSWHLYFVARFNRVSTSSTKRTYSCSTCKGRKSVSAPFCRYFLHHSFTPATNSFKVTGHTDLAPSILRQQVAGTSLLRTPRAVELCSQSSKSCSTSFLGMRSAFAR